MDIVNLWKGMKMKKFNQEWSEEAPEEKMRIYWENHLEYASEERKMDDQVPEVYNTEHATEISARNFFF